MRAAWAVVTAARQARWPHAHYAALVDYGGPMTWHLEKAEVGCLSAPMALLEQRGTPHSSSGAAWYADDCLYSDPGKTWGTQERTKPHTEDTSHSL